MGIDNRKEDFSGATVSRADLHAEFEAVRKRLFALREGFKTTLLKDMTDNLISKVSLLENLLRAYEGGE
jgi:hypothetical protein